LRFIFNNVGPVLNRIASSLQRARLTNISIPSGGIGERGKNITPNFLICVLDLAERLLSVMDLEPFCLPHLELWREKRIAFSDIERPYYIKEKGDDF